MIYLFIFTLGIVILNLLSYLSLFGKQGTLTWPRLKWLAPESWFILYPSFFYQLWWWVEYLNFFN